VVTFQEALANDVANVFMNTNEFARSFTLLRNGATTTGIAAIVAARQYDASDGEGGTVAYAAIDLDLAASAYRSSGNAVDPRPGDRFTDATSGDVFEVLPIPGGQCYEPSEDGLALSVHVKKVA
jgi:hypothetical protein